MRVISKDLKERLKCVDAAMNDGKLEASTKLAASAQNIANEKDNVLAKKVEQLVLQCDSLRSSMDRIAKNTLWMSDHTSQEFQTNLHDMEDCMGQLHMHTRTCHMHMHMHTHMDMDA